MRFSRIALLTVLTAAGVFGVTTPAWAHTHLESSNPAGGASLAAPPSEVKLTFGEAVSLPANPISVAGPGGATWKVGEATLAGAVVTAPITATSGPAGAYVLTYRVTADDGDAVTGTVRFTLTAPVAAPAAAATPADGAAPAGASAPAAGATESTPAAAPATGESSGGVPVWVWVLLAVVVIGVAAGAVVRSRRA